MPLKLTEVEMAKYICILLCAVLVAGELVYRFPGVTMDTPENMMCPSDSQLEAARDSTSANLFEILINIADNISNTYTIPDCEGSGWRRIAFLNMTDPDQTCPEQWRLYQEGTIRACGRQYSNEGSCDSAYFSSNGYTYSKVCGRLTGYQYTSPDGIFSMNGLTDLDGIYIDGVSITYGDPRQHLWSLFGSLYDSHCCIQHRIETLGFVNDNYFCDTGNPVSGLYSWVGGELVTDYPLWDGVTQCGNNATCCAPSSGPWFNTMLSSPSTSDIEVRICGDQSTSDEDTPVALMEIYIK